ncbi:hypothetical protein KTT_19970 [Tengunoibacter tsumagoiensis]|uniref:ATP-dependent zinc metalloprotease FtsH n=2 Tax=Tengunoibacter tsumagoiensis TaxID=2014871 RepID=A0A401ZZ41_9CHLR|nr:hypothetical protein KTT_19970 [Tengunoibacter tsumagoiensis]
MKQWLSENRGTALTWFLVAVLIVLGLGILSSFHLSTTNSAPTGAVVVDYSTFVHELSNNNVQTVAIQDDQINGWLKQSHGSLSTQQKTDLAHAYTDWRHVIGIDQSSSFADTAEGSVDTQHAITLQVAKADMSGVMPLLDAHQVEVHTLSSSSSPFLPMLLRFLPLLLVILLFILFFSMRMKGNHKQFDAHMHTLGKSKARHFEPAKKASKQHADQPLSPKALSGAHGKKATFAPSIVPDITFEDVAGINEVRSELVEIVQFLREPERFNRLGAHIPHGALLVGPPGTGKTLLAKAVAGEANVPFFSLSASEFVEMFVGVGASRIRDLFQQARRAAPCVIFLDEIDAVGRKRSMRASGNEERDQTLNQLLVELDGFDPLRAVVVMAATNRVDILDNALLRPGRFDRRITVSLPDRIGRAAILKVHTKKKPLAEDVSLERLAHLTTGMTGADLANLANEAALSAVRHELEAITHDCFEEALARVQLGALRPIVMDERERRIIAVHEGGHALVAHHLAEADTVNRVTILPRGQSLGVTQFTPESDRYNYSRETLMARIAVGLGGRVAEEITFGAERVTTGAENDLQVVTDLARRMVTRWGMSERLGVVFADYRPEEGYGLNMRRTELASQARTLVADQSGRLYLNGPETTQWSATAPTPGVAVSRGSQSGLIDGEVQRILHDGKQMARQILMEHNDQLTLLTNELLEHEQLDRKQFEALLQEK